MLTESENEEKPYVWSILLSRRRRTACPSRWKRSPRCILTTKTADADRRDDGERDRVVLVFDAAGGGRHDQLCHRPPGRRRIGYGVAVEGKDDNGNELTFKLYIPFSSEIKPELTPEDFTGEAEPQENQAFIRLTPEQNPVAITQDAFFQGGRAGFSTFPCKTRATWPLCRKSVTAAYFIRENSRDRWLSRPRPSVSAKCARAASR